MQPAGALGVYHPTDAFHNRTRRYILSSGGLDGVLRQATQRHIRGIVLEAENRRRARDGALTVIGATTTSAVATNCSVAVTAHVPPRAASALAVHTADVSFQPVASGVAAIYYGVPKTGMRSGVAVQDVVDHETPWFTHVRRGAVTPFTSEGSHTVTLSVTPSDPHSDTAFDVVVLITPSRDGIDACGNCEERCPIVLALDVRRAESESSDANVGAKDFRQFAVVDGKLRQLERVFGDDDATAGDQDDTAFASHCLVCWENLPLLVLLPCRHRCVCSGCLPHLELKCPLCRNKISTAMGVLTS